MGDSEPGHPCSNQSETADQHDLVDAGLVSSDEVWIIPSALYGMTTAPRDWAHYPDEKVRSWRWTMETEGRSWEMRLKPFGDQNMWGIYKKNAEEEVCEGSAAFCATASSSRP